MATTNPVEQQTWTRWSSYAFSIGLILWVAASVVLGIPHGPGHSIESMKPLETMRDVSLPLWVGGLAGIAGALALQTRIASEDRRVAEDLSREGPNLS